MNRIDFHIQSESKMKKVIKETWVAEKLCINQITEKALQSRELTETALRNYINGEEIQTLLY